MTAAYAAASSILLAAFVAGQQIPARDTMPSPSGGTAVVSGIVVTAVHPPQPMRRVTVSLSGSAAWGTRSMVTDETGRFQFDKLPAGRYLLSAYKPAYLVAQYRTSASGTATADTAIAIAEGQRLTDIALPLVRGGVITGRVTDERGLPHAGALAVQVSREHVVNGERRLTPATSVPSVRVHVDERGVYRIFGLEPGEYLVSATARYAPSGVRVMTSAEIDRAIRALRRSPSLPGVAAVPSPAGAVGPPAPTIGDLSIYYPGTDNVATATRVTVAAGEERAGIDFRVWPGSTVAIRGRVVDPAGALPVNLELRLFNVEQMTGSSAAFPPMDRLIPRSPGPNGEFTFTGVAPGRYVVAATTTGPGRGGGLGAPGGRWAKAEVSVFNADLSDVLLTLQPGVTVSGQVVMVGTEGREPSPARVRVSLLSAPDGPEVSVGQLSTETDAVGRFTISGVMPGRYTFRATPSGPSGAGWILRSATANGRDVADHGLLVEPGSDAIEVGATFSDRPAEVSGILRDASGNPSSALILVLFPADRLLWPSGTRRVQQARPATDGRFILRNVLAGEYLLAAVTAVDPATLVDLRFLESLVPAAIPVTVAEGEKKTQNVRIR
jgi:hypothetical protein